MIAIYCRVSSEEQARNENINIQIDFAKKYANLHNLSNIEFFCDEGISGVVPLQERPAGSKMMQAAKANGSISEVLFYRLDRLGRSARLILNAVHELEQNGIRVKSMTEPFDTQEPTGRFLLTILAGVADLERETIVERTYNGQRRAVQKGKWPGTPPFGYMKNSDGLLEQDRRPIPGHEHLSAAGIVELIYQLVGRENYTTVKVADYLNALGVPPASEILNDLYTLKGRRIAKKGWMPAFIWHVLHDETYIGKRVFNAYRTNEEIVTEIPPIISAEEKRKVDQVVEEHSRVFWYKPKHQYLLTGLIRCGVCGMLYSGRTMKRAYQKRCTIDRKYVCSSKRQVAYKSCGNSNIDAYKLEDTVWDRIIYFVNNPGAVMNEIIEQVRTQTPDDFLGEEKRLDNIISEKETERQRIMGLYRKGLITMSDVEEQLKDMEVERQALSQRLSEVKGQLREIEFVERRAMEATELLLHLGEEIKGPLSFERKRLIIKAFIKEVIILPDKPRKPLVDIKTYFDIPVENNGENKSNKNQAEKYRNLLIHSEMNNLRYIILALERLV